MGDIVNAVADVFGVGPASKQAEAVTSAAGTSSEASKYAADIQRQSAQDALALQKQQFDAQQALQQRMYEEGVARQQPWLQAGQNALAQMRGQYNAMPAAFTGQVDLTQDPGYAFRLAEGQKALERSAAARGMQLSGSMLKGLTRYGQDMGSQEYQNAYNRALTNYNAAVNREATGYNRLASMAGLGQTTANTLGAAGQNYANALGAAGQNYATGAGGINTALGANLGNLALTNAANQGNLALGMGNVRASQYGTMGSALNTAMNTNWNALGQRFGIGGGGGVPLPGGGTYNSAYSWDEWK